MPEVPRVRFAPSPTGHLHVGGARTALFNWLFARHSAGVFLLRIEDTDRERSSDEMTRAILDGLRWLGLDWDEGPYHQADGLSRHLAEAQRLVEQGAAYRCFCTAEELQRRREAVGVAPEAYRYDRFCLAIPAHDIDGRVRAGDPFTIRFRVPEGDTEWTDLVHGPTRFRNADIEDFVILRSDGTPTYNLAAMSDDREMRITHVIRGDDHLANTPKQILLYQALDATIPHFAHVPMILGADGKRLSKRHGATSVEEYARKGILPNALVNFLALLGWSPGDDREIMPMSDLVAAFSLERINKKSAVFDPEKLEWMNGQYLIGSPSTELLPRVAPLLVAGGLVTDQEIEARRDWFLALIDLLKVRSRYLPDIVEQAKMFLAPRVDYDPDAVARHWRNPEQVIERLGAVRDALAEVEPWEQGPLEAALRGLAERLGVGFGKLAQPLRLALTGTAASPGIDDVITMLGPGMVRQRIDDAITTLSVGVAPNAPG